MEHCGRFSGTSALETSGVWQHGTETEQTSRGTGTGTGRCGNASAAPPELRPEQELPRLPLVQTWPH